MILLTGLNNFKNAIEQARYGQWSGFNGLKKTRKSEKKCVSCR